MRSIAPLGQIQGGGIKSFSNLMNDDDGESPNEKGNFATKKIKRRAVACKSCHTLKVKCIPSNPDDLSSECVRCIKSNKVCEIDLNQTRKKRKPDDRVSELESRIEKLMGQLQQKKNGLNNSSDTKSPASIASSHSHDSPHPLVHSAHTGSLDPPNFKGNFTGTELNYSYSQKPNGSTIEFVNENNLFPKRQKSNVNKSSIKSSSNLQYSTNNDPTLPIPQSVQSDEQSKLSRSQQIDQLIGSNILTEISNYVTTSTEARLQKIAEEHVDVIDRNLITLEEAKERVERYRNTLYVQYPFVKIPDDFDRFRKEEPILFVTVMNVAGIIEHSVDEADVNKDADFEALALKEAVHEFLLMGNKSIELLKSLLLLAIWYNSPELFHHRRYHIISSLCLNMAQDLGLTGRPSYSYNKQEGTLKKGTIDDFQNSEYRTLCMGVYSASVGFSLFLRRRLQVQWSSYMESSFQSLMSSSDGFYRNVALLGKITSLMERIHVHIESTDETNFILIDMFAKEIEFFKNESNTFNRDVYLGFISSIEAFLYSKFNSREYSIKSYHACGKCIEHFANLTPDQSVGVPVLIFGRLMYCFALFLKTTNVLKLELDLKLVKSLLLTLERTQTKYKRNHMIAKIRLLFYFYLTTYAKDEDVFNNITHESSTDAVTKSIEERNKRNLHASHSVPNLANIVLPMARSATENFGHVNEEPNPPYSQIRFQNDGYQTLHSQQQKQGKQQQPNQEQIQQPQTIPEFEPVNSNQNQKPVDQLHYPVNINQNSFAQNNLDGHMGPPQQPFDPNSPYNTQIDRSYPLLDALSDATMKGFNEFNGDFLGNQGEFWKMFDYKDDQFFL